MLRTEALLCLHAAPRALASNAHADGQADIRGVAWIAASALGLGFIYVKPSRPKTSLENVRRRQKISLENVDVHPIVRSSTCRIGLLHCEEWFGSAGRNKAQYAMGFEDPNFPASDASLGTANSRLRTQWVRAGQLRGHGPLSLFGNSISSGGRQGTLGDCWLLGVFACVAEFPGHDITFTCLIQSAAGDASRWTTEFHATRTLQLEVESLAGLLTSVGASTLRSSAVL